MSWSPSSARSRRRPTTPRWLVPSLVDTRRLDTANSRNFAAQLVADDLAGPPLGGVLFAVAASAPFFAMGGLWAAAGALALALPRRPRDHSGVPARGRPGDAPPGARTVARDRGPVDVPPRRPRAWADALAGAAWLRTHGLVAGLAGIGAVASVGYMLAFSILVVFARDRLDLDASGYGVVLAISAAGGLVASLVTPALRTRLGYRWTIAASLLLGAVSLGLLAVTHHPVVAAVLLAGYIAHAVAWGICATSLRQRLVPSRLLGRVNAAVRVLSLLGLAVGAALGGLLADLDVALPVGVGGAVFLGAAVAALALFRPPAVTPPLPQGTAVPPPLPQGTTDATPAPAGTTDAARPVPPRGGRGDATVPTTIEHRHPARTPPSPAPAHPRHPGVPPQSAVGELGAHTPIV